MPKAKINVARAANKLSADITVTNYTDEDEVLIRRADDFRPTSANKFTQVLTMTDAGPDTDAGLDADGNYAYQPAFATTESKEIINTSTEIINTSTEFLFKRTTDIWGDIVFSAGDNRTL